MSILIIKQNSMSQMISQKELGNYIFQCRNALSFNHTPVCSHLCTHACSRSHTLTPLTNLSFKFTQSLTYAIHNFTSHSTNIRDHMMEVNF